jgi:hypothetical protein
MASHNPVYAIFVPKQLITTFQRVEIQSLLISQQSVKYPDTFFPLCIRMYQTCKIQPIGDTQLYNARIIPIQRSPEQLILPLKSTLFI